MPRIPDTMLESIFYLYPSIQAAESGENFGGCGFLILFPFDRARQNHLYAVTNRHVIDSGALTFRLYTKDHGLLPIDSDDRKWFRHPDGDDLAILLIDFPITFSCTATLWEQSRIVSKSLIQEHDLGVGEEAFSIGRLVDHDGKQQHSPVVRFGNIAQMPGEKIRQDTGFMQESYLVEGRSVGGYSGSPVYIFIPPWAVRPGKPTVGSVAYGPWRLGVNWGHLVKWQPVCDATGRPVPNHGMQVAQNTGMMTVVPAWKLAEMLDHSQMKIERAAREDVVLGNGPPLATSDFPSFSPHNADAVPEILPD